MCVQSTMETQRVGMQLICFSNVPSFTKMAAIARFGILMLYVFRQTCPNLYNLLVVAVAIEDINAYLSN